MFYLALLCVILLTNSLLLFLKPSFCSSIMARTSILTINHLCTLIIAVLVASMMDFAYPVLLILVNTILTALYFFKLNLELIIPLRTLTEKIKPLIHPDFLNKKKSNNELETLNTIIDHFKFNINLLHKKLEKSVSLLNKYGVLLKKINTEIKREKQITKYSNHNYSNTIKEYMIEAHTATHLDIAEINQIILEKDNQAFSLFSKN